MQKRVHARFLNQKELIQKNCGRVESQMRRSLPVNWELKMRQQIVVEGGGVSVGVPTVMTLLTIIVIAVRKVTICNFPRVRKKKYLLTGVCRYTHGYLQAQQPVPAPTSYPQQR